jgi:hypothetical protein
LTSTQRAAIEGKSILLQQPVPSQFALISSSSTVAGALDPFTAGANAGKSSKAGNTIVEQDHLVDPATIIGPALLAEFVSMYGMKSIAGTGLPTTLDRHPRMVTPISCSRWRFRPGVRCTCFLT